MLLGVLTACAPAAEEPPEPTPTIQPTAEPTLEPTPEPTPPPVCNLTVATAELPQAEFAGEDILAAAQKCGVEEAWKVSVETIDENLGYEAYKVEVAREELTITVTGGDTNGLMYGGLEVAEQIALANGPEGVIDCEGAPSIANRGIKFNAPLDMRTPSYTDAGEAAQLNIPNMWDMDFWTEYFDELARNRYNAFSLWNLNPFPSMVKVEDYPDIALDDVWRTTLPFDDSYNGTATNLVRPEHWENYEVVKEMTIDEKIDFWRAVMAYAHDRGIKFYVITWNIYTYGEQGKYGIDNDSSNETTIDYFRKSVEAMVDTYPDLDGLGAAAGENMDWTPGMESVNENWLWQTYGLGINDALEKDPDREFTFIHRLHLTEFDLIGEIWADFKGTLDVSDKYSIAHMHSSTNPPFTRETFELMPEDMRAWLEMRSDDMYYARWGDPDFAREYLSGMPGQEKCRGFLFGTDGYIIGRDYTASDSDEYGILHIQKHWYEYMLWGRLGYDLTLSNDHILRLMEERFEGAISAEKADELYEAMALAGKIIPQVQRLVWQDGDNNYPEMCLTNITSFGFLDIKYWANSSMAMEESGVMSIPDYVKAVSAGESDFDLQTPLEAADALEDWSTQTLDLVETLLAEEPETASGSEKEFYNMVKDQQMLATMGMYYSVKIRAAVELGLYNETEDTTHQETAIGYLEQGLEYWKEYAELFDERYVPLLMGRLQLAPNPTELIADAEEDISIAETWRIRKR